MEIEKFGKSSDMFSSFSSSNGKGAPSEYKYSPSIAGSYMTEKSSATSASSRSSNSSRSSRSSKKSDNIGKSRGSISYNSYRDDASYYTDETENASTLGSEYTYDDEAQTSYGSIYESKGYFNEDQSDLTSNYTDSYDDESANYFKRRKSKKSKYDYVDFPEEGRQEKCAVSSVMKFFKKSDAMYETELLNFLATNCKDRMQGGPVGRKKYSKLFTLSSPIIVNVVFIIISVLLTSDAGLISSVILLVLSIIYVYRKQKKCREMCYRYGVDEKNARRSIKY